jgi:hypothetical protein
VHLTEDGNGRSVFTNGSGAMIEQDLLGLRPEEEKPAIPSLM